MATLNKKHHMRLSIQDIILDDEGRVTYDVTKPVTLIAYGYKENPNHGIFKTIQAADQILCVTVEHRSDDEVITIRYKDGQREYHDGSDCRIMDFDCYSNTYITPEEIDSFIQYHLYNKKS